MNVYLSFLILLSPAFLYSMNSPRYHSSDTFDHFSLEHKKPYIPCYIKVVPGHFNKDQNRHYYPLPKALGENSISFIPDTNVVCVREEDGTIDFYRCYPDGLEKIGHTQVARTKGHYPEALGVDINHQRIVVTNKNGHNVAIDWPSDLTQKRHTVIY